MLEQKKAELANLTIDYKTMYENLQKSTELHNMKITELEGTLNEYLKTIGQLNLQIETQKKMLKDEHTLTIKELTNKINDLTLKCNYFTNKELFKKINTGGLKEKKEKIEKLISDIVPKDVISNKISKLRITPENEKVLHHIFTHKQYDFLVKTDEQKSGKHAQLEYLALLSKLTSKTGSKIAIWFRNFLALQHRHYTSRQNLNENRSFKFFCTYIDPCNIQPEDKLFEFMNMTSQERRSTYFLEYLTFDKENHSTLSLYTRDKVEINNTSFISYLKETISAKQNRTEERNNQLSYSELYL
jgi:CHASE3 domain sensor protein